MARQETVTIKIAKGTSGTMSVECDGFIGEGCNVLKDLESQLGMVKSTSVKDEAYQYEIPDPVFINVGN